MKRIVSALCAMVLGVGLLASCSSADGGGSALSSDAAISSLKFEKSLNAGLDKDYSATWNSVSKKWVFGPLPAKTDVTALIATFVLSNGASAKVGDVAQFSGETANDFSSDISYVVTAADGTVVRYAVSVTVTASSSDAALSAFSLSNGTKSWTGTVNETSKTVALTVATGTDVSALVATFTVSSGSSVTVDSTVQESGTTTNSFSNAVVYRVTAQNGTTYADYTVTVTVTAASTATAITAFSLANATTSWSGTISGSAISVSLPYGTAVSSLVATWTVSSGASVKIGADSQISGSTANDFSSAVSYLVTAEDEKTTATYTVTVTVAAASAEAALSSFSLSNGTKSWTGTIDASSKAISVTVDTGTSVSALIASYTVSTGATVQVDTVSQTSGTTANDFTNTVAYTVTAQDGTTSATYTVTVIATAVAKNTEAKITAFSLGVSGSTTTWSGVVDESGKAIAVTVPYGTTLTALVANFSLSSGASAAVGTTAQVSGTTSNSFSSAVTYVVTAEDGTSTASYAVTVTILKLSALSLTAGGSTAAGAFDSANIYVVLPDGASLSSAVMAWTASASAVATIGSTALTSGSSSADFSSPVALVLTAPNGAAATYTVTAATSPSTYAFAYADMSSPVQNSYGLVPTASVYESVTDHDGNTTTALHVTGSSTKNSYVFTTKYNLNPKGSYTKISFWIKGTTTSTASTVKAAVTFQVGSYDTTTSSNNICFVGGTLTSATTLSPVTAHAYTGSVNTSGNWIKVTLDVSSVAIDNKTFSMKVGVGTCDFYVDDFMYE